MRRPPSRLTIRRMMIAVVVAAVALALARFLFIDNRPGDILWAAISAPGGHFTVYADGYSESRFRSLRAGMTVREVEDIMGPPLTKGQWQVPDGSGLTTPGEGVLDDIWYYSRAGKARGSYWRRDVCVPERRQCMARTPPITPIERRPAPSRRDPRWARVS